MPPVVPVLTAVGGGSAVAGGLAIAGTAAGLYGASQDRKATSQANQQAQQQIQRSQEFIERQLTQARGDAFRLFPAAQESRQQGIEAGMNLFNQSAPLQMQAFQQGNMGAQQALAQGLPQFQNAILGQPINYAAFQPQQVNVPGIEALFSQQPRAPVPIPGAMPAATPGVQTGASQAAQPTPQTVPAAVLSHWAPGRFPMGGF
jgi:hypothetical protein